MSTKIKLVLAAALVFGTASAALAGGYVVPGSTAGVNPAYHPRWYPEYGRVMRAYDRADSAIYSGVDGSYPSASGAYAPARALARRIHRSQHEADQRR
jgi:hypothetical protein